MSKIYYQWSGSRSCERLGDGMRASGILLPIASLPSNYGIGCFDKEAYKFADLLKTAGQSYWQILPLGPTGYGDSPYQSFSTFAGNPYFVDFNKLIEDGLLKKEECDAVDFGSEEHDIDYEKIYLGREGLLKKAYKRDDVLNNADFDKFVEEEKWWLFDYALYTAIKDMFGGKSWLTWPEDIRLRKPEAMARYTKDLEDEIRFHEYVQYLFYTQWNDLKSYINKSGIKIIGDIPIYVAMDSADTWSNTEVFMFDERKQPTAQAGVPPDGFSKIGQLWGNPLYDWDKLKETGYDWWKKRMAHQSKLYDMLRIDHFRGLDSFYEVGMDEKTAENGKWVEGPGIDFFHALKKEFSQIDIIAEDLGYLTDSVRTLLKETGFPGMKVLQFAFDSRESSDYLPHNYHRNCVVYTGTHDNDTTRSWFDSIKKRDKKYALAYVGHKRLSGNEKSYAFIRLAMSSVANLCVIPIQDYLALGGEARINTPSTLGENWKWRLGKREFTKRIAKQINKMTVLYGRKRK